MSDLTIQRLGPDDGTTLALLATDDADFDLAARGRARVPLSPEDARRFLADPAALTWVARAGEALVGFLYCVVVPLRSGVGRELLLYEIGVREAWRRRGVGRALCDEMEGWMAANGIRDVWVLADNPGAVSFYSASGFSASDDQPTFMVLTLAAAG